MENPFPGPRPYRSRDRARFFGREDLAERLAAAILAHRCTAVYGPSGAGKSSLLQAAAIPRLEEAHGVRAVQVDGWPGGVNVVEWVADAMVAALKLGTRPAGEELGRDALLVETVRRAARRSDRPILLYLDQLEQLFFPGHDEAQAEALLAAVDALAEMPVRGLCVVLSLREDYLGRFRDRARARRRLLDNGFRVGPLTVGELTEAVCQAAAAGVPSERWSAEELRPLMLQVRVPGQPATAEAEAQAAYAQIVCRAHWFERAERAERGDEARPGEALEAAPILERYLESTVADMGPRAGVARRLLEDHLVAPDGSRALRSERELDAALPGAGAAEVLERLEAAAILHAEEHHGGRYFEIGHDWLARKVHEHRLEREQREEEQRREAARQAEVAREDRRRQRRRRTVEIALAGLVLVGGLAAWAEVQRRAKGAALAEAETARAMAGARELLERHHAAEAAKRLLAVDHPERVAGWADLAESALAEGHLVATLRPWSAADRPRGDEEAVQAIAWRDDRIVTVSIEGGVRVRDAGPGQPRVVAAPGARCKSFDPGGALAVPCAAISRDGARVAVASDGDVTVYTTDGSTATAPVVLGGAVAAPAFSADGLRVAAATKDDTVRVYRLPRGEVLAELVGHEKAVLAVAFSEDGRLIATGSEDGTARVWDAGSGERLAELPQESRVNRVAWSPDGKRLLTAMLGDWSQRRACIWDGPWTAPPGKCRELHHASPVYSAAWSADGTRVAIGSNDHGVHVWDAAAGRVAVVHEGHGGRVVFAGYSPSHGHLVSLSTDTTVRLWPERVVLGAEDERPTVAAWNRQDGRVATAYTDGTVRIWSVEAPFAAVYRHDGSVVDAAFRPDGKVVTVANNQEVTVWPRGREPPMPLPHGSDAQAIAVGPDDRIAVAQGAWLVVCSVGKPCVHHGDRGPFRSVAWAPSHRIATLSSRGETRVWDPDAGGDGLPVSSPDRELPSGQDLASIAWSPDGMRLLTVIDDRMAGIVSFQQDGSKAEPTKLQSPGLLRAMAWSPDASRVVLVGRDDGDVALKATIYRAGSGAPTGSFAVGEPDPHDTVRAAWLDVTIRVVTTSLDGTTRIWDSGADAPMVLHGHASWIRGAVFSPDGKRLLTASDDTTARVWETTYPALLQRLGEVSKALPE